MNEAVKIGDVMAREYVGVSESDSVAGVARLMRDDGVESAVVLRGREPVGILSAMDVASLVADGRDAAEATVSDVMSNGVTAVSPDDDLGFAISALTGGDVRRLVVTTGDEVVGTLSEQDLVAASLSRPDLEPELEAPGIAATAISAEGTGPEAEEFSTQSVCEVCGTLAGDLVNLNGQLVCSDCRDV